jgi:hypothetical protein
LVILIGLAALLVLGVRWAWRDRRVDFIHSLVLGPDTDAVAGLMFDRIVPVLADDGYVMVAQAGHTTVFERRFFPAWTVLVAIFFFPVGLLALLARGRESIVVVSQDDVLDVHGYCRKLDADFIIAVVDDAAAHYAPAA